MSRSRTPPALVKLERCSLVLGGRRVLDGIDFELRKRQRWALVGANGSGKTLLLKLLRGDLWPTPTGEELRTYQFGEEDSPKERIAYVGPERQDRYIRREWDLSVTQVVTTGVFGEDIPLTQANRAQSARVTRLLKRFGLWGLRRRRFLTLSYGQRRLALLARAFAGEPDVLLLDEVFNGLDAGVRGRLRQALEQSGTRGPAWVLSTHRAEELPGNITHIAYIRAGRIVAAGTAAEMRGRRSPAPLRLRSRLPRTGRRRITMPQQPLVRIERADVYRDYRPVLQGIDWTLRAGEHWAIVGRNGSGKSTLLSLIYGDLHPALGGIIERRGVPSGTPIEAWKKRVGFVSPELQAEHFRAASIEEIVVSGRHASVGLNLPPTRADRKAAGEWLRFFGLTDLAQRGPREVSYGQLRLALIARAMVLHPELLLLDEPFTGLDVDLHAEVRDLIDRIAKGGTQIVMAVHHRSDFIPSVTHVLEILRGGRIRLAGKS
jgi:molybdate transport system ATP-binding protein